MIGFSTLARLPTSKCQRGAGWAGYKAPANGQNRRSAGITSAVPVSIETPEGWGPTQLLVAELERLGYRVERWRVLGGTVLVIT
jgi:hypothetical protein